MGEKFSGDALPEGRKWLHKERIQIPSSLYLQLQKERATTPDPLSAAKTMCCNRIFIFAEWSLSSAILDPAALQSAQRAFADLEGVQPKKTSSL